MSRIPVPAFSAYRARNIGSAISGLRDTVLGEPQQPRRFHLTVETAGKDPLTVSVSLGPRPIGIWVVRPGEPESIGLPKAGKATLRWKSADGTEATRDVIVTGPKRVKL